MGEKYETIEVKKFPMKNFLLSPMNSQTKMCDEVPFHNFMSF